ncbi:hypothetical protein F442_02805 [Phytophthora nicotianae P10297]|uniref:Uncharacterized protein n=2 Tax=Phytophthora nicotianae TaxID=4792 RepID=W3A0T7_PHYNI|nr:hypothetical protein L914_02709 [Phytophthora nicotianae]ETP52144.1 hypothetical protein F442_02805 [Phytophthora nicotianae P10297]
MPAGVASADGISVELSTINEHSAETDANTTLAPSTARSEENMKHFDSLQVEFGSSDESQLDPESRSLDPELVQSATEMGTESTELDNSAVENDRRARAVDLDDGKDEFELQSSPKAKGRPKQKPKAVKAKRNMNIAMVQEDIVMNEKQLSLLSVFELLADDATFNSAQENILQFKLFIFAKKPKPPIAHEIMKLPTLKPLARPDEIVRIFPMDLSKKCGVEVTAYQRNNNDVRELDIALEIVGLGIFANSIIKCMRK